MESDCIKKSYLIVLFVHFYSHEFVDQRLFVYFVKLMLLCSVYPSGLRNEGEK